MKRTIAALVLALLVVTGFAQETKQAEKAARALLVMEKTKFKVALIDEMQSQLVKSGIKVTVVPDSKKNLKKYKASDYDAVFITNSGVMSKVRPWVRKWLKKNPEQKSRILLHTTQTKDWEVKVKVDAVTSASAEKEVAKLGTEYVNRLKKILEPETDE